MAYSPILRQPKYTLYYSSSQIQSHQVLDTKDVTENINVIFNFNNILTKLETIATVTCTITTKYGVDVSPSNLLNGSISIATDNLTVNIPITGGLDKRQYLISVSIVTTLGNTYTLKGLLPVYLYI